MNKQNKKEKVQMAKKNVMLSQSQKNKCIQKFQSYKALGSSMLSKNQLRRVLVQLGRQITEEQLLEMIYEADPHGHGYISYQSFEKIVKEYKQKKEENIYEPICLTFDQILQSYNDFNRSNKRTIPWSFIQNYFEDNFGLKINLKNFKTLYNKAQVSKEDFKVIFS